MNDFNIIEFPAIDAGYRDIVEVLVKDKGYYSYMDDALKGAIKAKWPDLIP